MRALTLSSLNGEVKNAYIHDASNILYFGYRMDERLPISRWLDLDYRSVSAADLAADRFRGNDRMHRLGESIGTRITL